MMGSCCSRASSRCRAGSHKHTQENRCINLVYTLKAVTMLRLALVALIAVLAHATTPDNVSSRLMIHVSFVKQVWGAHA